MLCLLANLLGHHKLTITLSDCSMWFHSNIREENRVTFTILYGKLQMANGVRIATNMIMPWTRTPGQCTEAQLASASGILFLQAMSLLTGLMFLSPFLPPHPKPGPFFTASFTGEMGTKQHAQSHMLKVTTARPRWKSNPQP